MMLTITHRPMTAEERSGLESAPMPGVPERIVTGAFGCAIGFRCLVGGPVLGALLMCLPLAALNRFHLPGAFGAAVLFLGMVGGFWAGLSYLRGEKRAERRRRAPAAQDLASGQVDVLHCTVSDVVELTGPWSESVYLLDLGDGLVLCLKGDCLPDFGDDERVLDEDGDPRPRFPCRTFDVVRLPESKRVLGVQNLGPPLRPSRTLDTTEVGLDDADLLEHGEILTISFQHPVRDLKPMLASRGDEQ